MNAPFTPPATQARNKLLAAHVERMSGYALAWAADPLSEWRRLAFLDALSFVSDSHVSDAAAREMTNILFDLRLSPEGFPLGDDGFEIAGAERAYAPLTEALLVEGRA